MKDLQQLALLPQVLVGNDLLMDDFDSDYFQPKIVHYFYGSTGAGKTRMT
jgi:hypothetical protein